MSTIAWTTSTGAYGTSPDRHSAWTDALIATLDAWRHGAASSTPGDHLDLVSVELSPAAGPDGGVLAPARTTDGRIDVPASTTLVAQLLGAITAGEDHWSAALDTPTAPRPLGPNGLELPPAVADAVLDALTDEDPDAAAYLLRDWLATQPDVDDADAAALLLLDKVTAPPPGTRTWRPGDRVAAVHSPDTGTVRRVLPMGGHLEVRWDGDQFIDQEVDPRDVRPA